MAGPIIDPPASLRPVIKKTLCRRWLKCPLTIELSMTTIAEMANPNKAEPINTRTK